MTTCSVKADAVRLRGIAVYAAISQQLFRVVAVRSSLKFYRIMTMTTWLVLNLLAVQTLMSEGLSHRDFIYARGTMEDELENWLPRGK